MTLPSWIKAVFLEEGAEGDALTSDILSRLDGIPVHRRFESYAGQELGKRCLCLASYKGKFFKPCPGTRGYICCGYQILNVGTNCPLDCSYCILQSYFENPSLTAFVNLPDQLDKVLKRIDGEPQRLFRVGTGEFTDSLALDSVMGWSKILLPAFSRRKNAVLELKTKTDKVQQLFTLGYRDRIILSWSLNSPYIAAHEEHGAAGLRRRLQSAKECQSEGFILGFHFDPLIVHVNWKEQYLRTLELLARYVDPRKVIWVSLGAFRFMPTLKWIIRGRHPDTCVLDGEFIVGLDGKMRYFKPIRIELYSFVKETLEAWHDDLGLYLCMESHDVWKSSLGWSPVDSAGLSAYLDQRVREVFDGFHRGGVIGSAPQINVEMELLEIQRDSWR